MKKTLKSILCCVLSCLLIFSSAAAAFADDDATPVIVINDITENPLVRGDEMVLNFDDIEVKTYFTSPFSDQIFSVFTPENLAAYTTEDGSFDILGAVMGVLGATNITNDVMDLVGIVMEIYGEVSAVVDFSDLANIDFNALKGLVKSYVDDYKAKNDAVSAAFHAIELNPDGTSVDPDINAGSYDCSLADIDDEFEEFRASEIATGIADEIGYDLTYIFLYDWRMDPVENAAKLNDYVEMVKEQTGSDKVTIVAEGYGATIAVTYFDQFADSAADSVKNYVSISSEFLGTSLMGDIYTDQLIDCITVTEATSAFIRYTNDISNNPITAFAAWMSNYVMNNEHETHQFVLHFNMILRHFAEKYIYEEFENLTGNAAGLWALVPVDDFDKAVDYAFGGDTNANADLYAKISAFKDIQAKGGSILTDMQTKGVNVEIVSPWDIQLIPIGASSENQADGIVDTVYSSFGATCIPSNDVRFALNVTQADDIDHDHLSDTFDLASPDYLFSGITHYIDASTCDLPENTWFIENMKHGSFNTLSNTMDFVLWLTLGDTQKTVWDDGKYPQFLALNRYVGDGGRLQTVNSFGNEAGTYLLGDVNLDGKITALDSALCDEIINGDVYFEEGSVPLKNADINGDGVIDETDSALILQLSAGLIEDMSAGVETEKNADDESLEASEGAFRFDVTYDRHTYEMTVDVYLENPADSFCGNNVFVYDPAMFAFKSAKVNEFENGLVFAGKPDAFDGFAACAYKFTDGVSADNLEEDGSLLLAEYVFGVIGMEDEITLKLVSTSLNENGTNVNADDAVLTLDAGFFVLIGDVDGNHKVLTSDAKLVLQIIAGLVEPTAYNLAAGDVNYDGKLTTLDAKLILRDIAGLINLSYADGETEVFASSK